MGRGEPDSRPVWIWVVPGHGWLGPQGGLRPAGLPGTDGRRDPLLPLGTGSGVGCMAGSSTAGGVGEGVAGQSQNKTTSGRHRFGQTPGTRCRASEPMLLENSYLQTLLNRSWAGCWLTTWLSPPSLPVCQHGRCVML